MESCLFCKIAAGEVPSVKVYEDDDTFAFRDIAPQAPVHILVIPKKHITGWFAAKDEDDALLAHLMRVSAEIAGREGLDKTGFRIVSNCGKDAQQTVPHLHLHILGGRELSGCMA